MQNVRFMMESSRQLRRLIVDTNRLLLRQLRYRIHDSRPDYRSVSDRRNNCGVRIFAPVINGAVPWHEATTTITRPLITTRTNYCDGHDRADRVRIRSLSYDRCPNDDAESTEGKRISDDGTQDGEESSMSSAGTALNKIEPKMRIEFTCTKCGVRNTKYFSKVAYTKGVVIIRCDGCQNNHLIADNLNWFGQDAFKVTSSSSSNVNESPQDKNDKENG